MGIVWDAALAAFTCDVKEQQQQSWVQEPQIFKIIFLFSLEDGGDQDLDRSAIIVAVLFRKSRSTQQIPPAKVDPGPRKSRRERKAEKERGEREVAGGSTLLLMRFLH